MEYIDNKLYALLGDALRDARDSAQMTLSDAASCLGVTTMTIQRYEKAERKPSVETVRSLCSAYNVDADIFMQGVVDRFHSLSDLSRPFPGLSSQESSLLSVFRSLSDADRLKVLEYADMVGHFSK